ncbi:MAG TPA: NADH-quinone oxidoreductase subunit J [Candidatus Binatia bacterium]|jgi:NADH-quinone oxidoreductase subunit J
MHLPTLIFFTLAAFLIISSLLVVFLPNVVHSALALVTALLIISIFFVVLQAPMVGVLQVLVYAGAIMVLFLFVIMFLNLTATEPRRRAWLSFAGLSALLLGGVLSAMLTQSEPAADPVAATELFGSPEMLARSLFNDFVLPFEIASVLLLVAIVGAVVLAKRRS